MAKAAKGYTEAVKDKDELASPCILVSNDDGIHAPGLKAAEIAKGALRRCLGDRAGDRAERGLHPRDPQPPARVRQISARRFAVDGTPTGLRDDGDALCDEGNAARSPSLGRQSRLNIADDVTYSGTIAATMEGTVLGVPRSPSARPSSATSMSGEVRNCAEHHGPIVIRKLLAAGLAEGCAHQRSISTATPTGWRACASPRRAIAIRRRSTSTGVSTRAAIPTSGSASSASSNPPDGDLRAIYDGCMSR